MQIQLTGWTVNRKQNSSASKILKSHGLLASIDVEATRNANSALAPPCCSCCGCENYRTASRYANSDFRDFLDSLGLNLECPSEIDAGTVVYRNPITYLYSGFFHMVGRLCRLEEATGETERIIDLDAMRFPENTGVGLTERVALLEETFPETVVQLEFLFPLPWVLKDAPQE